MGRASCAALLFGGLGLLYAGGVVVGAVPQTEAERRFQEVDPIGEEPPAQIGPTEAAAISEPDARGASAPSAPARASLRPRAGADPRATAPKQSQSARVVEGAPDPAAEAHYIVDGETLRRAIEEVDETLSSVTSRVGEALSGQQGMGLRISSATGTATLDSQGFTVTDLGPLQESFGLQVGDTIVSVNSHRVDSPQSAYWIFQNVFVKDPGLTTLRLEIYRGGARLYQTYRIAGR